MGVLLIMLCLIVRPFCQPARQRTASSEHFAAVPSRNLCKTQEGASLVASFAFAPKDGLQQFLESSLRYNGECVLTLHRHKPT